MTSDNPTGPSGSTGQRDPSATPGMGETAKREYQDARERLSHASEGARHEAREVADRLKQRATDEAEGRKASLAESLHVFADTIREASDDLGRRDQSLAARLVRESANGLERMSRGLDQHSVADATRGLRSFGREHPVAFVAGGMIAGLAIGRMLRASGHRDEDLMLEDRMDHGDTALATSARSGTTGAMGTAGSSGSMGGTGMGTGTGRTGTAGMTGGSTGSTGASSMGTGSTGTGGTSGSDGSTSGLGSTPGSPATRQTGTATPSVTPDIPPSTSPGTTGVSGTPTTPSKGENNNGRP